MTVSEFKRLTDKPFTEEEFEKIHFVYENYPKSNDSIKIFYGRYSEAKTCPFCGGTEILVFSELSGSDIEIACAKCGAKVRFPGVRSRKEAIKIWSRRTNNA